MNKSENNMAERLDLKKLARKAEKTVYDNGVVSYYWEYKEKDGATVIIDGDKTDGFTEERKFKNSYYNIYKEYYPTGIIKEKGIFFGEAAIDLWYSYDEQGNLINTEEARKRGRQYCEIMTTKHKRMIIEIPK